jgi:hypothetical protein
MPYNRMILGPRYSVRLADVQASDAIDAECIACGQTWRIAPHRLHDRYEAYFRLKHIGEDFESACKIDPLGWVISV